MECIRTNSLGIQMPHARPPERISSLSLAAETTLSRTIVAFLLHN